MLKTFLCTLLLFLYCVTSDAQLIKVAHSHNDYLQDQPLFTALNLGFTSIEVDVCRWRGKVKVSHLPKKLWKKKTIEALYLEPLRAIIQKNNGTVYPNDSTQLILMVDLKKDKIRLLNLLFKTFKKYEDIIEYQDASGVHWGPVKILLSGMPDIEKTVKQKKKYFKIDAIIARHQISYSGNMFPRVSTDYRKHFEWRGEGKMPNREKRRLRKLVRKAHRSGQKIRFWATPDHEAVWKELLDSGVDWINVDDLEKFSRYYSSYVSP